MNVVTYTYNVYVRFKPTPMLHNPFPGRQGVVKQCFTPEGPPA